MTSDYTLAKASDPLVQRVVDRLVARSEEGIKKFGTTMLREDRSTIFWLENALEEALDFAVYIERVIYDLRRTAED